MDDVDFKSRVIKLVTEHRPCEDWDYQGCSLATELLDLINETEES